MVERADMALLRRTNFSLNALAHWHRRFWNNWKASVSPQLSPWLTLKKLLEATIQKANIW